MEAMHAGAPPLSRRTREINLSLWGAWLVAGLAAGVVGGILARVAMRLVVLIEAGVPSFTLSGTLGILFLFALPGILIGAISLALARATALRTRTIFLCMAAGLTLLLIGPLYLVATGDLPNAPAGRIAALMVVFLPVPLAMAWVAVYGGAWLQNRNANKTVKSLPIGWAAAAAVLTGAAFISAVGALSGAQRHPRLVSTLLGTSSADFTFMADRLRAMGLAIFAAYMALTIAALWRQSNSPSTRRGVLLALALPTLLLTAGTALPPVLGWLPAWHWLEGGVRALGIGALLALFLVAGGFRTPRWLVAVTGAASLGALVLLAGAADSGFADWLLWGILGAALSIILLNRWFGPAPDAGSRASSLLLTLFALTWLGLWAAALTSTPLQLPGMTPFAVVLTVKLFWLHWLLLPAALLPAAPDSPLPHTD